MNYSKCSICNQEIPDIRDMQLGVRFILLETTPFICNSCFYNLLTNKHLPWVETVKRWFKNER